MNITTQVKTFLKYEKRSLIVNKLLLFLKERSKYFNF